MVEKEGRLRGWNRAFYKTPQQSQQHKKQEIYQKTKQKINQQTLKDREQKLNNSGISISREKSKKLNISKNK